MKILMLNNEFPPLGGGTGSVNQAVLERFAALSALEVDLVTSSLGRQAEDVWLAGNIHLYKTPVNNRNIHHSSNRELLTYAARALPLAVSLQRKRRYDLCLAWSAVPAGAVAFALHTLTGLPYLVRVSGPDIPGFEQRYGSLYPILTPVIRTVWRRARLVIAKCDGEAAMIRAVDQTPVIELVPNGVDPQFFAPGQAIPDHGPLQVLCVARLIERKGQHYLIEAVKRLVDEGLDIILTLVGTGDAESAHRSQVEQAGLHPRVRFVGYVPRESIASFYAQAHVFVLASYNEGMSVATLEAMASGLPVVITRTGGTVELVEEGVNGFSFDWGDIDSLTTYLRRLSADRSLARRMGLASRRRAERFSWDATAHRLLALFRQNRLV